MQTRTKPFNRWLSLLMAFIMLIGLFPNGGILTAQAEITNQTYDGFELPVAGSTGYGIVDLSMNGTSIPAGAAFRILADEGESLKIKYGDNTGTVPTKYVMINLPDVVPSIVYNATNATGSMFKSMGHNLPGITGQKLYTGATENKRLGKSEFNMPVLYKMAKKLAAVQFKALKDNRTLILYEGFRPAQTQADVRDAMRRLVGEAPYSKSNPDYVAEIDSAITSWGPLTWFISTKDAGNHQKGYAVDVGLANINATGTLKVDDKEVTIVTDYSSTLLH